MTQSTDRRPDPAYETQEFQTLLDLLKDKHIDAAVIPPAPTPLTVTDRAGKPVLLPSELPAGLGIDLGAVFPGLTDALPDRFICRRCGSLMTADTVLCDQCRQA